MGIEGAGAHELGDLTEVAEIVIGELVEHVGDGDGAEFGMMADAGAGAGGDGVKKDEVGAAKNEEFAEMVAIGFGADGILRRGIVFLQVGLEIHDHDADAIAVGGFDGNEMGEDLGDGPAIRRGLPIEEIGGKAFEKGIEQERGFGEERDRGLKGRGKDLHG